jgi:hypothetical protein
MRALYRAITLFVCLSAAPCYAQLTTANVFIDNRTGHLADVWFTELAVNPSYPPQKKQVQSRDQLFTTIAVPPLVGGTYQVSAFLYNPTITQPAAEIERIEANSFKYVEIFRYGPTYYLVVTDFDKAIALARESGSEEAKKRIAAAYELVKKGIEEEGAKIPPEIMKKIEKAFEEEKSDSTP